MNTNAYCYRVQLTARGDEEDQGPLGSANIRDWMGIDYATAVRKAQDRDQWLSMVSKVPDGYGTCDLLNFGKSMEPYETHVIKFSQKLSILQ